MQDLATIVAFIGMGIAMAKDSTPPDIRNFMTGVEMPLFAKMQLFLMKEDNLGQFSEPDRALITAHKERFQAAQEGVEKWNRAEMARICINAKQRDRAALAAGDIVEVAREISQVHEGYEERLAQFHQSLIDSLSGDGQRALAGLLAGDLARSIERPDYVRFAEANPQSATQMLVDSCNPNPNVRLVRKTKTNEDGSIVREIVQYVPGGNE